MTPAGTAGGSTVYISTDFNTMPFRIDYNTGPGQGSAFSAYSYNGLNQRDTYRSADGVSRSETYDGAGPGAALLSDGLNVYTPGVSQRSYATGASEFSTLDGFGTLRNLRDGGNTLGDDTRFDAFGLPVYRQNDPTTAFGYEGAAGYQSDYDSGLILCGSRYYDPSIGRFYSPDRAKAGTSWYEYCGNDPLTENDPTGLLGYAPSDNSYRTVGQTLGAIEGGLESGSFDAAIDLGAATGSQQTSVMTHPPTGVPVGGASFDAYLDLNNGMTEDAILGGIEFSGSFSPSAISLGSTRYSFSVGVVVDFTNGKFEFFSSVSRYEGYGGGASYGPSLFGGDGTLDGFNGASQSLSLNAGKLGSMGLDWNNQYTGFNISPGIVPPPFAGGQEYGVWSGETNTSRIPYTPTSFNLSPYYQF